jgi:hypothetical protein
LNEKDLGNILKPLSQIPERNKIPLTPLIRGKCKKFIFIPLPSPLLPGEGIIYVFLSFQEKG